MDRGDLMMADASTGAVALEWDQIEQDVAAVLLARLRARLGADVELVGMRLVDERGLEVRPQAVMVGFTRTDAV
jgi:hypothetical protein